VDPDTVGKTVRDSLLVIYNNFGLDINSNLCRRYSRKCSDETRFFIRGSLRPQLYGKGSVQSRFLYSGNQAFWRCPHYLCGSCCFVTTHAVNGQTNGRTAGHCTDKMPILIRFQSIAVGLESVSNKYNMRVMQRVHNVCLNSVENFIFLIKFHTN
jgi:hypothetical protein